MATRETIDRCLVVLVTSYPRQQVAPETATVYTQLLSDLPDDLLESAVQQHCTTSKWFPTVAEIRQAAGAILDASDSVPEAGEAWAEALRIAKAFSEYDKERTKRMLDAVSHPLVRDVICSVGGIEAIGATDDTGLSVMQSHFVRNYRELRTRQRQERLMLPAVRDTIQAIADKRRKALPGRVE